MRIRLAAALLTLAFSCAACGQSPSAPDSAGHAEPYSQLTHSAPDGDSHHDSQGDPLSDTQGDPQGDPHAYPQRDGALGGDADAPPDDYLPAPRCLIPPVIAHRGEGGDPAAYPENTSLSELDAARHGADLLNLDVRWTADGVPVALHDPTVDRTTSGSGPITALTAAQYTALTSRDNAGRIRSGWHPQTLAEVLAAVRGTGLPFVIQIESDPLDGSDPVPAGTQLARFARTIGASGYAAHVVVAAWTAADLIAFRAAAPTIRTAFLQNAGAPTAGSILATGARILYLEYTAMTAARVAAWHHAGLTVWAWTPPAAATWAELGRDRVDAIATNWVPSYARWASAAHTAPCHS